MSNPYQKPAYLTETEKNNCYATNRGWVILKPNGKYDIVESIANLDVKIKEWHESNKVEFIKPEIKAEHVEALTKANKSVVSETYAKLEAVKVELAEVNSKIEEIIPVLKEEVKSVTVRQKKDKKAVVEVPVAEEVKEQEAQEEKTIEETKKDGE